MKGIKTILAYLKKYRFAVSQNILFNLLSILFSLVSLSMIAPFLQLLFKKEIPVYTRPIFKLGSKYFIDLFYYYMSHVIADSGRVKALFFLCVVVSGVFFLKNLFRYLALYFMASIRSGVVRDIQEKLYEKILQLPLGKYSKYQKGDLISRMTSDVKEIEHSVLSVVEVSFKEPATIIVFLIALLVISPQLTAFVLIMLGIMGFIIGRVGRSLKKESKAGQEKAGLISSMLEETISGIRIIKAFNTVDFLKARFERENSSLMNIMNKMLRRRDLSSPLTEFLAICVICTVLWFGGNLVLSDNNSLQPETFIAFMLIFSQLIPPAKSFATAYYSIQKGMASSDRINEILSLEDDVKDMPNALSIDSFNQSIEYKNVCFAYNNYDDHEALSNINFKLEKGKMLALVGPSGSGKSTLVDLLCRFYEIDKGEILMDGNNITEYKVSNLRARFGIVSQEPILFNDTIFNNIAFGINAGQQVVEEAAKIANAHDFIMKLPEAYQTKLSDRGMNLSGGERQRLTIARAILKNPDVLILDEATSSLDSESEKLVQAALNQLMKNRTSIVIAHRLSTIQYADEILVMQDGSIVERGNHIGLIAKNGLYKKLVDLQGF